MKALCWHGKNDVRVERVPDPAIREPGDAIIRVTTTGICGSDLHILHGLVSGMKPGDIIGHEPMGIVEDVGTGVQKIKKGDRVVVSFDIACGACWFCDRQMFSLCDCSNPTPEKAAKQMGMSPAACFGYSHVLGGIPGGQAEFMRVPFADVNTLKIPETLSDDQVVFLSDIFPTGWMAAENCDIQPGETVAVWGAARSGSSPSRAHGCKALPA